ncbi:hypothetical protein [Actinacidiphila bryophytorum]|uniref:Secreted protein n=1 Tax=Actinacidiphila bryophytorum TaxID=1436133 RepID=A0A9W4EDB8_9ACTN|nr:hypothetical protein [Actinacidiphila bryophytorum]MBM9439295.1 hypothetical protein [Actinacidiphila bryophytorum]MBN6545398.1 hypothetical protein [Actinacidiphila bryophytorum]CAG7619288.1 conserved membrane hypothetical protein [Actinacidiphila bryophytorum]
MTTSQTATATAPAEATAPAATATAPAPAVRPESYRPRRRLRLLGAGPRRLGVRTVASLAVLGALCTVAVVGAAGVRHDTARLRTTVTERAAVAVQLRFALADLDAQRADTLAPGHSANDPDVIVGNQLNALITAQQRRGQVSDLLRQLGADRDQGQAVADLLNGLGRYDDLSGRAAYVAEQDPDPVAGHPPRFAVAMNVQAGNVMHDQLLPAADALSAAYQRQADDQRAAAHDAAARWTLVVWGVGLAAIAVLLWWQWDMAREYRRRFNPALLAATAAAVAVTLAGGLALSATADAVNAADGQGLRPWTRLAEARAVAAQAAASESRWFVHDTAFGAADQKQFDGLVKRLDTLLAPAGYATGAERPAYQDVLARYGHFRADDTRLRALKRSGDTEQAAAVLTEVGRGDVAFDFWDFATTLDKLAARQLDDFSAHAGDARSSLDGWPVVPAGGLGLAAALVLVGVRPRLAEYR